jgi:hypothetical protein
MSRGKYLTLIGFILAVLFPVPCESETPGTETETSGTEQEVAILKVTSESHRLEAER